MKIITIGEIEELAFIGSSFAQVEVEKVNVCPVISRGWHSKVVEKEMTIYADEVTKKSVISKISTALSKKSRRSKKDIENFIKGLK
jgi:hypothetical protein